MKTVSGKVVSSQRISLSKAAKLISRFTASDNEAAPAFAAYLRRTSTAFNDLVRLHSIPLGDIRVKKDHSSGVITQGTANSVKMAGEGILPAMEMQSSGEWMKRDGVNLDEGVSEGIEIGLNIDENSRNVRDKMEEALDAVNFEMGMEVEINGRSFNGNVSDERGVLKKSKKKKGSNGDVAISVKNQAGEHNINEVNDVNNEIGSLHGSEEVKTDMHDVSSVGKKSKKKRGGGGIMSIINKDEPHGDHNVINVGNLDASEELKTPLPDGGGDDKKSKKKRGRDGDVAIIAKDQSHDAINVNEVKNEMGNFYASEETKKKRDKDVKENHDGALETVKDVQLCPHRQNDGIGEVDSVQNNGDEQKKHKKKSKVKEVKESSCIKSAEQKGGRNEVKEEMESCSIRSSEQRCERNVENKNDLGDEKKHKKKRRHETEERENGRNIETEAADKKASRKRKHERVTDGELDGSQEADRSKKKKI